MARGRDARTRMELRSRKASHLLPPRRGTTPRAGDPIQVGARPSSGLLLAWTSPAADVQALCCSRRPWIAVPVHGVAVQVQSEVVGSDDDPVAGAVDQVAVERRVTGDDVAALHMPTILGIRSLPPIHGDPNARASGGQVAPLPR